MLQWGLGRIIVLGRPQGRDLWKGTSLLCDIEDIQGIQDSFKAMPIAMNMRFVVVFE